MDDMGIIDLSQVEENRKQSENDNLADDAQQGLSLGIGMGKRVLAGLDSMILATKNKLMDKRGQVSRWMDVTPGVQQWASQAREIGEEMRPSWWASRADQSPEQIGRELVAYAQEREERARRREQRGTSQAPRSGDRRRYDLDALTGPGWVSRDMDAPMLAVCRLTAEYMAHPDRRPQTGFPPVRIKDWGKLSDGTRDEYKKILQQAKREMREQGVRTPMDVVGYLADKCRTVSRSRYNSMRGCILQSAHAQGNNKMMDAIRAMPPYVQLCRMLGKVPSSRQGEITRQRKRRKHASTWQALLEEMSPRHADAVRLIRATGARVGECQGILLTRAEDGTITAAIPSSKQGARGRGRGAPATREIVYTPGSPRYDDIAGIYARQGEAPADMSPSAIQNAWSRARRKVGGEATEGQVWTLHSLRHAYAKDRKDEIFRALRAEHGRDWRVKLFGRDWNQGTMKRYAEGVYGELARELGHTDASMAKRYG
jgi:hypothetical protein